MNQLDTQDLYYAAFVQTRAKLRGTSKDSKGSTTFVFDLPEGDTREEVEREWWSGATVEAREYARNLKDLKGICFGNSRK